MTYFVQVYDKATGENILRPMTEAELAQREIDMAAFAQPVIPESVTMRQARLALLAAGKLEDVQAAIAALGGAAAIEWEYATEVNRSWALVAAMTPLIGTEEDVDALFIMAASL